jgi:putative ABC transport system permease protein
MATCSRTFLYIDATVREEDAPIVGRHYVAPDHFRTLGIPLVAGRPFEEGDRADRPRVAIINASAARRLWPDGNAIGRRIHLGDPPGSPDAEPAWEIVGVVGDVVYWPPDAPPGTDIYSPYPQHAYAQTMVIARTSVPPLTLVPALRAAVASVDPDLPIDDVRTLDERVGAAISARRFQTVVLSAFAGIALLLAVVGVYGVASIGVRRRTRELGVRGALGATPASLLGMILRDAARTAAAGIAAGAIIAFATTRVLRSLLEGVGPTDPPTFLVATAVLLLASLAAALVPATRAARTDPLESLRPD